MEEAFAPRPLAQDWAINGFGTPTAVYLLYVVKLVVFCVGAALMISARPPPPGSTPGAETLAGSGGPRLS